VQHVRRRRGLLAVGCGGARPHARGACHCKNRCCDDEAAVCGEAQARTEGCRQRRRRGRCTARGSLGHGERNLLQRARATELEEPRLAHETYRGSVTVACERRAGRRADGGPAHDGAGARSRVRALHEARERLDAADAEEQQGAVVERGEQCILLKCERTNGRAPRQGQRHRTGHAQGAGSARPRRSRLDAVAHGLEAVTAGRRVVLLLLLLLLLPLDLGMQLRLDRGLSA
jgi:hypothetical protein